MSIGLICKSLLGCLCVVGEISHILPCSTTCPLLPRVIFASIYSMRDSRDTNTVMLHARMYCTVDVECRPMILTPTSYQVSPGRDDAPLRKEIEGTNSMILRSVHTVALHGGVGGPKANLKWSTGERVGERTLRRFKTRLLQRQYTGTYSLIATRCPGRSQYSRFYIHVTGIH